MNLRTGESYIGRLAITRTHKTRLPLQGTSGQGKSLRAVGYTSPPGRSPYGPKAESRSWAGEKTPMEPGEITRDEVVSIFFYYIADIH